MKYSKLAEVYEDLEGTTKKLEKRDIVAKFFKETPADLLPVMAMLVQGRIFPAWMETELGVAEKIMIKAIVKTSGRSDKEVKEAFKKSGDMGLAVEDLLKRKKQATLAKGTLTVEKVYKNLTRIPELTGLGSIERKIGLIADMLSDASPKEGKYIARTVLEDMRVGVGEGTIRDAISAAFDVPAKDIERAYNVRNDYGEVARSAKEHGLKGLEKFSLKLGRPIKPMLAQKVESLEAGIKSMGGRAAIEIKYDGMRVQIHKDNDEIALFTRRLDNVTKQFPEIVEYAKKGIKAKSTIVEGEVVGIDPKTERPKPFQQLSRRIKRKYDIEEMMKQIPVDVNLFDIVYLDGKMLIETPFKERRSTLKGIIHPSKRFHLAEQVVTDDPKEAEKIYNKALKMGHEGAMVKNLESPYTPGSRVKHMNKVKPVQESLDLVIMGAIWGEGRRSKWLGSFVLGARDEEKGDFVAVGKVATGVKDADLEELTKRLKPLITAEHVKEVELKPKLVIEINFEEIQKSPTYESGFALRFPRVVRIREDKGPEDVDSLDRIERMYSSQGKA